MLRNLAGNSLRMIRFQCFLVLLSIQHVVLNEALTPTNPIVYKRFDNRYENLLRNSGIVRRRCSRSRSSNFLPNKHTKLNLLSDEGEVSTSNSFALTDDDKAKCHTLPRLYVGATPNLVSKEDMSSRLFQNSRFSLSSEQTHYLVKVMRFFKKRKRNVVPKSDNVLNIAGNAVEISHCVRVFDGVNGEWLVKILDPTKESNEDIATNRKSRKASGSNINLEAVCIAQLKYQAHIEKLIETWVIFAPIKKQRLKILVEKCTELGTDLFCPVITDHTEANQDYGSKELQKLSLVACEASEQSERLSVPKFVKSIRDIQSNNEHSNDYYSNLKELLDAFMSSSNHQTSALLVCRERSEKTVSILEAYSDMHKQNLKTCLILVGPEGGFSKQENALLDEYIIEYPNKIICVSLGSSIILRAETAAITAVAAQTLWTDSKVKESQVSV